MSGGSGSRVNAATLLAIRQQRVAIEQASEQQHPGGGPPVSAIPAEDIPSDHGLDDGLDDGLDCSDCLPFEMNWDPQEPVQLATVTAPPPVSALDAVAPVQDYATMTTGSVVYTKIYSAKSPLLHAQYDQECHNLLENAFAVPGSGLDSDLGFLLQAIANYCNFQVIEVTRVENKPLFDMHTQFKESYAIAHTRRTYHGTGQAASIAGGGFRGAASKRAKFGKGIYTSTGVFQALAYGELTLENTLTFVVAQLHLGPMGFGTQDQVDFGRDPAGQQILTLMNPEGDIFCASHESQLLPTHIVTVRYQAEVAHTDAHYARVGVYNAALWNLIKHKPLAPADAHQAPPQDQAQALIQRALVLQAEAQAFWTAKAEAQASLRWKDTEHCLYTVGSVIKVIKVHHKKFNPYINFEGVIRRIVARGADFMFFVQIQRNALGDAVDNDKDITDLNRRCFDYLRPDERGLLPCKNTHMSRNYHLEPPPQVDQGPAKKPRLDGQ